jgi:hypothetical protein
MGKSGSMLRLETGESFRPSACKLFKMAFGFCVCAPFGDGAEEDIRA